jgi:raffinose/stachyose/melibiose transport system substrate-binding protein
MRQHSRSAIAGIALTTMLLGACSSGGTAGGGQSGGGQSGAVTINYWTEASSDAYIKVMKQQVVDFNKSHPNVKVNVRYVTTEFRPVIRNAFTAGNAPEIFDEEGYTDLFDYVKENQVLDVSDWFNKPGNGDRFEKASLPSVTYQDKVYAIPAVMVTTNTIWYNKKILNKNGIDPASLKTWDDFLAAFAKLKSAGVTPIAYGAKEGWPGSEWYFHFLGKIAGGKYMNQLAAGNCGYKWTDPPSVQAAQMYIDLQNKGYFSQGAAGQDWNASNALFLSGKAGFYQMGSWFVGNILDAPNKDDFGLITFPTVSGGKGGAGDVLIAPQGFALSKSAQDPAKKQAALTFLDWFTQPEQQKALNKTGNISAVSAANDASSLDPFSLQIVNEQIKPATNPYTFLEHATTLAVGENAIWKGSVAVLTGQMTAQSWMESVQKAAEQTKGQNSFKIKPDCSS